MRQTQSDYRPLFDVKMLACMIFLSLKTKINYRDNIINFITYFQVLLNGKELLKKLVTGLLCEKNYRVSLLKNCLWVCGIKTN